MAKNVIGDPGVAKCDMMIEEIDHDVLFAPIWEAAEIAINCSRDNDYAEVNVAQLLLSARETHDSMRAVYTGAKRYEEVKKRATGRWADMLVLARAQLDAVFVGLLIAHDPNKWGPLYYKAGWASEAQAVFYSMRRHKRLPSVRAIFNHNVWALKGKARLSSVNHKEWIATLAAVRGRPLRFRASGQDAIKPFPTPGQIRQCLIGGDLETLGTLLWQEWKFLCDPAHGGMAVIAQRYGLREQQFGNLGTNERAENIHQVVSHATSSSFVAMLTLITLLATKHRSNVDLLAKVTKAWDVIQRGTREGGIVWDNWARGALGILDLE